MAVSTSIFTQATLATLKTYLGGDGMVNSEPVHDVTRDLDATLWNKIVAGLAEVALRLRPGNLVALMWSQANVTAGQTDVELARGSAGDAALKRFVAPAPGAVTHLSARVENARTGGTLTVKWTKNGEVQANLPLVINGTNTQAHYVVQLPSVAEAAFVAGDQLGIAITTDGSWAAGSTPSLEVDMLVALTG
jgi:hypothetical protein